MKAAIVQATGQAPIYADFTPPDARAAEVLIDVAASALSHVTKSRASGKHYSSSDAFPFIPGVDGVGRLEGGRRVFFVLPRAPYGAMAEQAVAQRTYCIAMPEGLDDVTAAAIANPGMSSWAALNERAKLQPGQTVLINGATGVAGRLAVQIAKYLGAGKVIATGRNVSVLRELESLGADATVALSEETHALEEAVAPHFAMGVDLVLDYLWGMSAERLLIAAAKHAPDSKPMRFVQVGGASGGDVTLPGAVLRSSAIELMGSGIGSLALDSLIGVTGMVLQAAARGHLTIATRTVPLAQVESAWNSDIPYARTVFIV